MLLLRYSFRTNYSTYKLLLIYYYHYYYYIITIINLLSFQKIISAILKSKAKAKAWTFEAKNWTFEAKDWTFEAKA